MRDLGEVDLRREVAADRCLERLVRREHAAGERPGAGERLERPLPQQRLQHAVPHLEHGGQGDLGWSCRFGRLRPRFTTHSQKLAKGSDDDKGPGSKPRQRATMAAVVAGLVAAVALLAAGCGSSNDAAGTTESTATDTTAAKAIKVGLITDLGQLNDNGFNEGAYNGLKRAERVLGVKGRVVESASAADYVPNMSTLAKQGYDLIIGVGFAQGDAIATAAKKYPEHEVRDRRRRPGVAQGQAGERRRVPVPGGAGRLSRRLPGRARGEARRREQDQRRRRLQGAAGRPLHRGLPGGREGGGARHGRQVGLLAGLGRPGEVQGARPQPDRGGLEGRLPGRRRLRPRRAARRQGAEGVGHRRRRRPVVPRPARADERAQGRRQRRLPDRPRPCRTGCSRAARNAVFGLDQDGVGLGKFSPLANKADIAATEKIEQQIADGTITDIPTTLS